MRGPILFLFVAAVAFMGNGRATAADEELNSVEGTVTFRGKPLHDTTITFHLSEDQFVGAKIKDGKYRIDRVPAGQYKVTIVSRKLKLPAKYASEDQTMLKAEVKKGMNAINIEISQ